MKFDDDINFLVGKSLGQFRIIERIGAGGMASVFKAYQPTLDRYVALKAFPTYLARDPIFVKRFTQEVRSVAILAHPNIVQIHDFGEQDGITYIVMEYGDGGTLKDRLKEALSVPDAVGYVIQAAEGLNYAHERGFVHKDLKPSNMLLRKDGHLLLSDFGIAKIFEGTVNLTRVGTGIGTPQYMSPEQGTGQPVDRRSDIYSLGIVLYHALTGRVPFTADSPLSITIKHLNDPIPIENLRVKGVPQPIEQVLLKMTAKAPADRYQTSNRVADDLNYALGYIHFPNPVVSQPAQPRFTNIQSPFAISEQTFPKERSTIRIFVSHSSKDNEFCTRLVQDLHRFLGDETAVWHDAGSLHGGDTWWRNIVKELTARPIFLVLLSPDSMNSSWVNDEIDLAWRQKNTPVGKRIIPVLVRPCEVREDLHLQQIVSFLPPKSYQAAISELLKALGL